MTTALDAITRPTPGGPLTLLVADGTVVAAGFADPGTLAARLPGRLQDLGWNEVGTGPVAEALDAYVAGDMSALDALPVEQEGSIFQRAVWEALRAVPAGTTASYAELAASIGRPNATRAVGSACGANLIAPLIPCHRAVRSDGTLGGYEYGLVAKRWLLDLEAQAAD